MTTGSGAKQEYPRRSETGPQMMRDSARYFERWKVCCRFGHGVQKFNSAFAELSFNIPAPVRDVEFDGSASPEGRRRPMPEAPTPPVRALPSRRNCPRGWSRRMHQLRGNKMSWN